ncbi:MAG: hypothetical protein MPW13_19410 [Candidatus Manganitrophus sp.]|nr:hypothetical protein [Candidatus Manganitrophus sp.]
MERVVRPIGDWSTNTTSANQLMAPERPVPTRRFGRLALDFAASAR